MKTCRKSVATVLLLLIHLLTFRIGNAVAEQNDTSVKVDPKIILEEAVINNDTRAITDVVAGYASTIGDQASSLLSKREIRLKRKSDLDTAESRTVDVNEDYLERMKHVIAGYEPQRLISRKTKRKIVNGAHDVLHGKAAVSTTDLESAYDEVLRNISRRAPELTSSNVDLKLNPYLSQVKKNLREIYAPETTIFSTNDNEAQKSRSDVDSSYTLPTLKDKNTKKLLKKYLQLNRTATIPQDSSIEQAKFNIETADNNESNRPEHFIIKVPNGKTKPKNESLPIQSSLNIYSKSTEKPDGHREWNIQDSPSFQTISPFIPQLSNNNSYNVFNVNNLNKLNFPSDTNTVQLLSRYDRMPRPFSLLRSSNSPVIEIPHKKPSPSLTSQQVARSSANVLPLILPTETLFDVPSARRYVPIKRANYLKSAEDSTILVNTEATTSADELTTFADYGVSYTDIIGTTKSPLVTVNGQRNYYAVTENPREQITTKTNSAKLIHVPSQTSYTFQQEKNPQAVHKNGFLPRITYNSPDDEKSNLNPNAALYNKFANLYSANIPNVFNVPKTVTQNYQTFGQPMQSLHAVTSQYVFTPHYATSKPISPPLLKNQPIASVKPVLAPYYNSELSVPQRTQKEEFNDNKKKAENVEINESRAANADESNTEAADKEANFENNKAQINHGSYKSYKTLSKQHEKEDREEKDKQDRYQQPKRNYDYQDKYHKYDKGNRDDKNDDIREKYVQYKDDKDEEEDADETQDDEYVNTEKSEDENNHGHHYQYNKHKYDRDNSEEEERDKQRYDSKKYDEKKNRHDEQDHETDVKPKFVSINKYFDGPRNSETRKFDEKYHEHYDRKKAPRDKNNRDEDSEDESFAEDKLIARRSKDERIRRQRERMREEYEKKQNKDDKTVQKRKHHRHPQTTSQRDSRHKEHRHEEYDETNPKQVREEYRHLRKHVKGDDRKYDSENDNEKTRDHEHGESKEHAHKHEEHHEKKKDGGDHKFEEGGGAEHKEEHHGDEGEKGHKSYKVWHENEKAEKGHHDKEHSSKEYDEKDGEEKKHEEEGGFHEEHQHEDGGKKAAEFSEKGEHKKGHSTHGEHSVHKKDEYEKKTEFFDEFHDDGSVEKHGGHHHEHESKKGGHNKKSHHDAADHEEKYGKEKKHEEGGHHHDHKGHKIDEGHDHHYNHDEKHGKKEGHEHGKKWSYKKGGGDAGDGHHR